jgi:hypothetical protein
VVQKVQSKLVTSSSIVAIALYDYTPLESEELEIKEGDNLIVLDDTDSDWWLVKIVSKKGGEGLVPKTYIEVFKFNGRFKFRKLMLSLVLSLMKWPI